MPFSAGVAHTPRFLPGCAQTLKVLLRGEAICSASCAFLVHSAPWDLGRTPGEDSVVFSWVAHLR